MGGLFHFQPNTDEPVRRKFCARPTIPRKLQRRSLSPTNRRVCHRPRGQGPCPRSSIRLRLLSKQMNALDSVMPASVGGNASFAKTYHAPHGINSDTGAVRLLHLCGASAFAFRAFTLWWFGWLFHLRNITRFRHSSRIGHRVAETTSNPTSDKAVHLEYGVKRVLARCRETIIPCQRLCRNVVGLFLRRYDKS